MQILGNILLVIAAACSIMLTADAYKKAKWKGWFCLLIFPIYALPFFPPEWLVWEIWIGVLICPLYMLYYGFKEFTNEDKGVFLGIWLTSLFLGLTLFIYFMPDVVNHHAR